MQHPIHILRNNAGATGVEYALVIALVALATISALSLTGQGVEGLIADGSIVLSGQTVAAVQSDESVLSAFTTDQTAAFGDSVAAQDASQAMAAMQAGNITAANQDLQASWTQLGADASAASAQELGEATTLINQGVATNNSTLLGEGYADLTAGYYNQVAASSYQSAASDPNAINAVTDATATDYNVINATVETALVSVNLGVAQMDANASSVNNSVLTSDLAAFNAQAQLVYNTYGGIETASQMSAGTYSPTSPTNSALNQAQQVYADAYFQNYTGAGSANFLQTQDSLGRGVWLGAAPLPPPHGSLNRA